MGDMKEYLAKRKAAKAAPPPAPAAPKPPRKQEAEPKLVITQACGHKIGVGYIQQSKYPRCQGIMRKARAAKVREKQANRAETKEEETGRLPDGSEFNFHYVARDKKWIGSLLITVPQRVLFTAEASAVLRLPILLDRNYREWLREQGATGAEGWSAGLRGRPRLTETQPEA